MGVPSATNGVINLSSGTPSFAGLAHVSSFVVNTSATYWSASIVDENSEVVFAACHSGTGLSFSHTLAKALLVRDLTSTLTNVHNLLIYVE